MNFPESDQDYLKSNFSFLETSVPRKIHEIYFVELKVPKVFVRVSKEESKSLREFPRKVLIEQRMYQIN